MQSGSIDIFKQKEGKKKTNLADEGVKTERLQTVSVDVALESIRADSWAIEAANRLVARVAPEAATAIVRALRKGPTVSI